MCFPGAEIIIPMVIGGGMQYGSAKMNSNAESKAARQRDAELSRMFQRQNQYGDRFKNEFNRSLDNYAPQEQERLIGDERQAVETRMGEQFQAAQANAPQNENFGVVTPGYTRQTAEFEAQRAEDAGERRRNYSALVAPEHVRQAQGMQQQQLGEQWNIDRTYNSALDHLGQMKYNSIEPRYSPWAGVLQGVGSALMSQGMGQAFGGGLSGFGQSGPWAKGAIPNSLSAQQFASQPSLAPWRATNTWGQP